MRPPSRRGTWDVSPALARAIMLTALLTAAGIALGRAELVLVGVPLAAGAAFAVGDWRSLRPPPQVRVVGPETVDSNRPARLAVEIEPSDAEIATVLFPPAVQDGPAQRVAVVAATEPRQIVSEVGGLTWGSQRLARPDNVVAGADGLLVSGPDRGTPFRVQVLPEVTRRLPPGPVPPRPAGMVGAHRTRRPGEGTELYDVAPFRPGDRLKRIDWKVTARQAAPHEEIFTRHTLVDADADVVCCLDNRYDVGPDVSTWSTVTPVTDERLTEHSSVDLAVETVAAIASAYLDHGDRVGVLDLTQPTSVVRTGSGARHLLRLRTHLAQHTHSPRNGDRIPPPKRPPALPTGAVVVLTSVFLDDAIVDLTAAWRRAGHQVLAVDVLPQPLRTDSNDAAAALALRIMLAERTERLGLLARHGVTVTGADPAELSLNLARLTRGPAGRRR